MARRFTSINVNCSATYCETSTRLQHENNVTPKMIVFRRKISKLTMSRLGLFRSSRVELNALAVDISKNVLRMEIKFLQDNGSVC